MMMTSDHGLTGRLTGRLTQRILKDYLTLFNALRAGRAPVTLELLETDQC